MADFTQILNNWLSTLKVKLYEKGSFLYLPTR